MYIFSIFVKIITKMEKIKTEQEYKTYCSMMDKIIAKGTELGDMELLSKADKSKYIKLSTMVREWEKVHHKFPIQQNPLIEEIKTKMAEKHLRQRETAQLLEINESRFSEILRGKKSITMQMAKKLYNKLEVPAELLIEFA